MFGVLRTICTVVGAVALYCGLMGVLWYGLMRAGRRRARMHAARRAAPVVRTEGPRTWDELPSWLWPDRSWSVAVVLLGTPSMRERTAPFVDFSNRVIDWPSLLAESHGWPAEQRLLVQRAYETVGRLEPEDGITTLS